MAERLTLSHFLFPGVVSLNDTGNLHSAAFISGHFTGSGRNHEQGYEKQKTQGIQYWIVALAFIKQAKE